MRSVTQGDVIRADAKDIPRIFQVRIALPLTHSPFRNKTKTVASLVSLSCVTVTGNNCLVPVTVTHETVGREFPSPLVQSKVAH